MSYVSKVITLLTYCITGISKIVCNLQHNRAHELGGISGLDGYTLLFGFDFRSNKNIILFLNARSLVKLVVCLFTTTVKSLTYTHELLKVFVRSNKK